MLRKQPAQSVQMALVGAEKCGKSSLTKQLCKRPVDFSVYEATIGAAFGAIKMANNPNPEDKLEIWDTAGHERYMTLVSMYAKKCAICMLVLDLSEADAEAQLRYLAALKTDFEKSRKNDGSKIIFGLVGTKTDLVDPVVATDRLKDAAARLGVANEGTFQISAKSSTPKEFEELRNRIYGLGRRPVQDHIVQPMPAEPAISYEKLSTIVSRYASSSYFACLPFFDRNRSETIKNLQKLVADNKAEAKVITYNQIENALKSEPHRLALFQGVEQKNDTSTDAVVSALYQEFKQMKK